MIGTSAWTVTSRCRARAGSPSISAAVLAQHRLRRSQQALVAARLRGRAARAACCTRTPCSTRTGNAPCRCASSHQRMPMSPRVQHLAQLVADQVDDGLEVQLGGDALLDAVDHRQLGVALLGLLQQALRLVEQARVLQRHAHARGDGAAAGALRRRRRRPRARSPRARWCRARGRCRRSARRATERHGVGAWHASSMPGGAMLGAAVRHQRLARALHLRSTARRRSRAIGSSCEALRRARTRTGSGSARPAASNQRMPMSPVCSTSRSLSPTRSTMAWKFSARRPCPAGCC